MSKRNPYAECDPDSLILRDWPALSRSRLANGIALAATGMTLLAVGLVRFVQENRRYRRLTHRRD